MTQVKTYGQFLRAVTASVIMMSAAGLAGCQTYEPAFKASAIETQIERSTSYYSYVGADRLIRQARMSVTVDTPLLVGTIGDINDVESSTALGRTIAEQISTRFVQRGYQIAELKLRNSVNIQDSRLGGDRAGEYLLSRDVRSVSGEHQAAGIVTGTYAVADSEVLVNLRIIDVAKGNVIAATDFTIPRSDDVNALLGNSGRTGFFGGPMEY